MRCKADCKIHCNRHLPDPTNKTSEYGLERSSWLSAMMSKYREFDVLCHKCVPSSSLVAMGAKKRVQSEGNTLPGPVANACILYMPISGNGGEVVRRESGLKRRGRGWRAIDKRRQGLPLVPQPREPTWISPGSSARVHRPRGCAQVSLGQSSPPLGCSFFDASHLLGVAAIDCASCFPIE